MINKHKFYSMALVSIAAILVLLSIVGATLFADISNSSSNNISNLNVSN